MKPFRVLVSGASGMIGTALVEALEVPSVANRFLPEVYRLTRHAPRSDREIYWDVYEQKIDPADLEGFDAVIHLAGENIGSGDGLFSFLGRWSEEKKHRIVESRRRGTRLLASALASVKAKPNVFVSMSGVGYYGDRGDLVLEDGEKKGDGFLSDVAEIWEENCMPASEAGIRTVQLRSGVVLSARGGVIQKLELPYLMGGGGPVGPGTQWMSWVTLQDAVRGIQHAMMTEELSGPVNLTAPDPCTSAEFATALGAALHRPAFIPMPSVVVETVFGEMGRETLLVSQRAKPKKLLDSGFRFLHPDIATGCVAAVDSHGGVPVVDRAE